MKNSTTSTTKRVTRAAKATTQNADWTAVVTIGIDIGNRFSHYCGIDRSGAVVRTGRMVTTAGAFKLEFANVPRKTIAIEAGMHSPWISRLLSALGHEVIVANPRKLRLIYENQHKNDRVDAEYLARLARLDPNLLGRVEHRSESSQAHLAILRARDTLVRSRVRLIHHVRAAIRSTGATVASPTAHAFHKRIRSAVPEPLREALLPLIETIEHLTARIAELDRKIEHLAEDRYPETEALTQVAGVGALTALAYVLTLENHDRFRRSRSVGAWLGLAPGQHQSGDSQPQQRITKEGDQYLRRLLVGSAHYIIGPFGPDCDLRRYGLALATRGGKNARKRAAVAVARKLAVLLHHLWRTLDTYEPLHNSDPASGRSAA
ncbi:MAG TPA: IS110 family transposase [Chthoniobacterales bacterium]|nr:IS110 family transposase [Chthoniobacterales bacterium]